MIMPDHMGPPDVEGVEESQQHGRLGMQRPVGVPRRFGVAEPQQVGGQAAIAGREGRKDLAPDERRKRAAVQQQEWRAAPRIVVGHMARTDIDDTFLLRERLQRHRVPPSPVGCGYCCVSSSKHSARSSRPVTHGSAMR
jgi:hypothetical protein